MTESGYPEVGFNPDVWMGVLAPAGTPVRRFAGSTPQSTKRSNPTR